MRRVQAPSRGGVELPINHLASGGDVRGVTGLVERRLSRGEPRQRNAVRRAAHVVEAEPVAETDRARVSAVLTADAELQIGSRLPAALDGDLHQLADTVEVERLEGIRVEHPVLQIEGQELALGVVARHAE